ncbi:MAG: glutamine--fructose-6-phosphate transaminase (isomerizing) [Muribaculaceae bacterium]|jgi:glucosamine--fructose-6-phosphate aminotransferase (isomerizing)|uniref:glutamine--fructose-6-phosphate transaminase (isomerizing) n=1 Tax=Sangeribacter muris TaxID=2880703 RepID=UPI000E7E715B|nr:glutamine--fructose-6-phosphate transaminase (isomerizing) [Sangeribacter muris]MBJ2193022.1 glutamine--fructose-6-phosphate transaminase (isomerizing) [Muribaculaceae bacterium]ROS82196.1 glutamine--fructose-6-phosphate transaminase (isomerizing) [Muribaculaceae bacterium Isolate-036 (Harlan)]ROT18496.1 glutamine--fructose-6-phosphate transaminase (isomerizing) [Muribaculaceae bacterium Isolate-114 (HZI)]ROT21648.1 glutamine--fructose-6-phosphate transaminase (isomerizing) [Muribaculaceae b
MCGIVGYLGNGNAYDVLIKGLHRLEYRGYDSAGIALVAPGGKLNVFKAKGKVENLETICNDKDTDASVGIAHTRWATHGEPSDCNAHPHYSEDGNLALVHNGTIENYKLLKDALEEHGCKFHSETDTEVLVQLIEYIKINNKCSLLEAVREALHQVVGAYAIAVVEKNDPDTIIAARQSSPLVIGIGDDETFLASDASPFVEYTKDAVYLNDGEIAVIRRNEPLKVLNLENRESKIDVKTLEMSISQLEKGGYPSFMLKEIFEQPTTLRECIRGRVVENGQRVIISGVRDHKEKFLNAKRIVIVACGTSWHAALIGKYLIQEMCHIAVEVEYASEFRYSNPVLGKDDIVIALSQSGETADTLAAVKIARSMGAFVFGISNAVGSSIPRETDSGAYIHVGPEIGVASTKAFTGQVMVLTMIAMAIADLRGTLTADEIAGLGKVILKMPELVEHVLKLNDKIERLSLIYTYARNFLYLGRGYNYPVALEGALKLKEISYIHAEGYPAAEMKHGPIALIDAEMPSVIVAPRDHLYEKIVSNVQQVKARGGSIIAIVTEGDSVIRNIADHVLEVPEVPECLSPIITSIPLQLLSYYIAINKGKDVDMPRNLAKSVTVE